MPGNGNNENKKNIILRLKRVEGQIRGVQRMMENGDECGKVLPQLKAAQKALSSAAEAAAISYLEDCASKHKDEVAPEVFKEMQKTMQNVAGFFH